MAVNWSLGQMPDIGMNALAAFKVGQEQGKQDRADNALAAYAQNQTPETLRGIIATDPRTGLVLQRQQQQYEQQQAEAAAKKREGMAKYVAGAAFDIAKRPDEAQQAAAWDAYIDQGAEMYPELAQYRGQYTRDRLNALVAEAGQMPEFRKAQEPHYMVIPADGDLVNTSDPSAIAQFQGRPLPTASTPAPVKSQTLNGKTYYQYDGAWHDEPPKGGAGSGQPSFQR